ncbi:MAG: response regulator [Sandaracinaceae bacterium]
MTKTSSGELTGRIGFAGAKLGASRGGGPPRLVVLMGSEPGRRFGLDAEAIVIGRSEECDVQLDDTKVSRRHAQLTFSEGAWTLEDLGSRNGTLVNGETVSRRELEMGDRIQLSGETLLLFTRQDPLEDLLLHRQQMAVIGQLAAGIAHDFNNLLNVIAANTAHLSALDGVTPLDNPEVKECHADIAAAATRAAELTARLLTIARRRERHHEAIGEAVDISQLCEDALHLVRRTFDRSITVESAIEPNLVVDGDHAALHQLLMNLCINARDAMPRGGALIVRAFRQQDAQPAAGSFWTGGPQVVIEVRDTGVGMDEKTRARVFEPFFTTKDKGAGSGLGLATVYEVATTHGGGVEVVSELGEGALFRIRLPARAPDAKGSEHSRKRKISTWDGAAQTNVGHGRVLVVDDQELVRRSLGRLLKAAGHEVSYAADGEEALAAFTASTPRPDVILMDLDMPRLSGSETLAHMRQIDPEVRVVLISGYYDEARKQRLLQDGATDFLAKPVDAKALRDSVRLAMSLPKVTPRPADP